MAHLRICARNAIDGADLSASPAAESTLPVTNLQIPARARVWRSTSAAEQVVSFDWNGAAYWLNFLALHRHNLEQAGTWRVQLYANADWTSEIYDSGTMEAFDTATLGTLDFETADPNGYAGQALLVDYFTNVLAKSGKVTLTDTGNSDGYVEASYLFAGEYVEIEHNATGEALAWRDTSEQSRSDGGTLRSDTGVTHRELSVELPVIHPDDRGAVQDMIRYAGKRKPIFVAVYPEAGGEKERDYTLLGKLIELPDLTTDAASRFNRWGARLQIGEI